MRFRLVCVHAALQAAEYVPVPGAAVDLPSGYKEQGTIFDRFGLMNSERGGNPMTIYFDDLSYDGKAEDFSEDPRWLASGNHSRFEDSVQGGAHDFGFSAQTSHAGGSPGELGGTIWRSGVYGYYAARVGVLTLTNRLEASGKVVLEAAPPEPAAHECAPRKQQQSFACRKAARERERRRMIHGRQRQSA